MTMTVDECRQLGGVLRRAMNALLSLQKRDGHFCGELEGDSILQSEYILMKFILRQEDKPMADGRPGPIVLSRIAAHLRSQQRDDGGWGQFPGSDIDLSATVKAYCALKLMGDDVNSHRMRRARQVILDGGGAEQCNSFTNFYLACLGQIPWNDVPCIPPEIMFLPRWFPFHLSKVSAWTRTMIVPLSVVSALRPTRPPPQGRGIDELFVNVGRRAANHDAWSILFQRIDCILKWMDSLGGSPWRGRALRCAEQWLIERCGQDGPRATEGLGAIFPPMVYVQIALHALGYERDHPIRRRSERDLDALFIEENGTIRIQPCFSPVWDTGIALYALADCGMTVDDGPARRAAAWLVGKECTHVGDWKANLTSQQCGPPPSARQTGEGVGGWFFEYRNAWYPDCDDTAMVAMALKRVGGERNIEAAARGVHWLLSMQNDDGGWAAFDRTRHRAYLESIPFADHNAMQDPSCADITGRVLECLSWNDFDVTHPAVRRAIEFLKLRQEPDGCWFGRWGVNYIYGTWQAVIGPIRCGVSRDELWIQRAGKWIKSIQKPDGSFGESAQSYVDPNLKGQGPSTTSQTAWAAMTMLEIFGPDDVNLKRAINWLITMQLSESEAANPLVNPDHDPPGSWAEPWFTGTGFPRTFYLRYHLYRLYFPLMAIARYVTANGESMSEPQLIETFEVRLADQPVTTDVNDPVVVTK